MGPETTSRIEQLELEHLELTCRTTAAEQTAADLRAEMQQLQISLTGAENKLVEEQSAHQTLRSQMSVTEQSLTDCQAELRRVQLEIEELRATLEAQLTGWMVEKAELEAQAKVADELKRSSAVKAKLEAVIEELEHNLSEQAAQKAELESR